MFLLENGFELFEMYKIIFDIPFTGKKIVRYYKG